MQWQDQDLSVTASSTLQLPQHRDRSAAVTPPTVVPSTLRSGPAAAAVRIAPAHQQPRQTAQQHRRTSLLLSWPAHGRSASGTSLIVSPCLPTASAAAAALVDSPAVISAVAVLGPLQYGLQAVPSAAAAAASANFALCKQTARLAHNSSSQVPAAARHRTAAAAAAQCCPQLRMMVVHWALRHPSLFLAL